MYWQDNLKKFEELKEKNVLFQINIMSLFGHYSPAVQKIAEQLIDNNWVNFVGTDCHNMIHTHIITDKRNNEYLHKIVDSGLLLNSSL